MNTFKTCEVLSGSEEYPSNLEVLRGFPTEYTSNISQHPSIRISAAALPLCHMSWHMRYVWTKAQSSPAEETCNFPQHHLPSFCHKQWPLGTVPSAVVPMGQIGKGQPCRVSWFPAFCGCSHSTNKCTVFLLLASDNKNSLYEEYSCQFIQP